MSNNFALAAEKAHKSALRREKPWNLSPPQWVQINSEGAILIFTFSYDLENNAFSKVSSSQNEFLVSSNLPKSQPNL